MAINSSISWNDSFYGSLAMLAEDARIAREKYNEQRRIEAVQHLVKVEQDHARVHESFLRLSISLADAYVAWGQRILATLTEDGDRGGLQDSDVRQLMSRGTEAIGDFLGNALDKDDDYRTRVFCEQAKKVADILNVVQHAWPWIDVEKIEESWRQYERGELMDFETFKNELLGPEK